VFIFGVAVTMILSGSDSDLERRLRSRRSDASFESLAQEALLDDEQVGPDLDRRDTNVSGSVLDEKEGKLQGLVMGAFAVNYIFGAGVLGIPYAVAHGGILASSLTLILSSIIGLMSMNWVLECQERANVMKGTTGIVEYRELCLVFIGKRAGSVYEACLTVFVISASWMYASITSDSLAQSLPIFSDPKICQLTKPGFLWNHPHRECWLDYLIYMGAFVLVEGILVASDVAKLPGLQLMFTVAGLFAVFLMVTTVCVALPEKKWPEFSSAELYYDPAGFPVVFSTFVFSQLCHHGVPLISYLPKNRSIVQRVFVKVIASITAVYLILGISCALFFGVDPKSRNPEAVRKIISLNWAEYTAGTEKAGFFAKVISFYISLYPAVTCGAAFPLYVVTLGNNWHSALNDSRTGQSSAEQIPSNKAGFYVAVSAPSIILASIVADTTFMLVFVGLSAFVIGFTIPPILQMQSKRLCPELKTTRYSNHFSSDMYCAICLMFATLAAAFTLKGSIQLMK